MKCVIQGQREPKSTINKEQRSFFSWLKYLQSGTLNFGKPFRMKSDWTSPAFITALFFYLHLKWDCRFLVVFFSLAAVSRWAAVGCVLWAVDRLPVTDCGVDGVSARVIWSWTLWGLNRPFWEATLHMGFKMIDGDWWMTSPTAADPTIIKLKTGRPVKVGWVS